jgi:hypothetical protein
MRPIILILSGLIGWSNMVFAQQNKANRSNTADKVEELKAYSDCTYGPCYSWWSIYLKGADELIMQHGAHYPPGSESWLYPPGKWQISGDTLRLNIPATLFNAEYMNREYLIVREYGLEILLPTDSTKEWSEFMSAAKSKFEESSSYQDIVAFGVSEFILQKEFGDFLRQGYSTKNKLLVQKIELPKKQKRK